MAITPVTAKTAALATSLRSTGSETSISFQSNESWADVDSGTLRVNSGTSAEWIAFTATSETSSGGIYTITATGCARGLDKDAVTNADVSAANKKDHAIGTQVILVMHSKDINEFANTELANTLSGDNTWTGTNTFSSTTKATWVFQNVTTAQRTALTGLANGVVVYDTDVDTLYVYQGAAWYSIASGSVQPDATESVKGVAELATVAEQGSAASTGGTGAGLALQAKYLVKTSAGAADENKIAILDSTGKYDSTFMPTSSYKFGGDGSDGAVTGAVTITGSNNTYIVKNYTSFAPGANTVTTTPTGCVTHIKVSGNADLTGTTFSYAGKGGPGGTGGAAPASGSGSAQTGNAGTAGTAGIGLLVRAAGGGAPTATVSNTAGTGGTAGSMTLVYSTDLNMSVLGGRTLVSVAPGAGGSGGASGVSSNSVATVTAGAGGNGGAGGGALILEVAGNITFSGTTITAGGSNGSTGGNGTGTGNNATGGGGGGGGGGGVVVVVYGGTLTGSVTPTVAGGTGGQGGTSTENDPANPLASGAGGAGGASVFTAASNGANGTAGGDDDGGDGGAGAAGQYLIAKNSVFQ